jgi:hypothetical protein
MRRGALVTGDGTRPLVDDLRRLPAFWLAFAAWLPTAALRAVRMRRGR